MPPEQDSTEPLLPLDDDENDEHTPALLQQHHHDDNPPALPSTTSNPYKNHNVRLCLLLCAVSGVADSVWGSVVLSGFLYALASAMHENNDNNTLVGFAEMVQGVSMLLCALPIGVYADRAGKSKVARWGGGLMLLTCGVTLWALIVVKRNAMENVRAAKQSYVIMLLALALWGVVSGISNGPIQALFADSIPKGKRSELLTWLYSCYLISSSIGPMVSISMLSSSDAEDWSIAEIFPVFFLGILLEIPAAIIMFFFSDKYVVLEDDDEAVAANVAATTSALSVAEAAHIVLQSTGAIAIADSMADVEQDQGAAPEAISAEPTSNATSLPQRRGLSLIKTDVPYILFLSSLVVAIGSGASVKYFPLFFKEIGLSSAIVQGIYFVVPVSISAFSFIGQRLGQRYGRIETSTAFNTLGTLLLYYLTWLSDRVSDNDAAGKALIVFIYLLRTGIMNCCYPLLESVLMDAVPSNQRAKWKSLESISAFGWTGSALVGGILSDKHSYQYTFAMTATVQLVGGFMMWPIRSLVESEVENESVYVSASEVATSAAPGADCRTAEEGERLSDPLLP
ncbi:hypothetical protein MPSEU_000926600 [Mayamaea pseudoterrestris]|nr:hypothetical protein MPSEU_000926600 [Mayamaea pseudoterrestris]